MKHNLKIGDQLPDMNGKAMCTENEKNFDSFSNFWSANSKNLVIKDFITIKSEPCVLADTPSYGGDNCYIFKIKDILPQKQSTDLTIKPVEAQDIINIACPAWKTKLADLWAKDIVFGNPITIDSSFYQQMRNACTPEQHKLFDKIFGPVKPNIDFDKLKTGSQVMIEITGEFCGGNVDASKPVDIVFYKTKHLINGSGEFLTKGYHNSYVTFHQNGNFPLFCSTTNVNYITKVIKY